MTCITQTGQASLTLFTQPRALFLQTILYTYIYVHAFHKPEITRKTDIKRSPCLLLAHERETLVAYTSVSAAINRLPRECTPSELVSSGFCGSYAPDGSRSADNPRLSVAGSNPRPVRGCPRPCTWRRSDGELPVFGLNRAWLVSPSTGRRKLWWLSNSLTRHSEINIDIQTHFVGYTKDPYTYIGLKSKESSFPLLLISFQDEGAVCVKLLGNSRIKTVSMAN